MDDFDKWNELKKSIENDNLFGFKDRDIFFIKMGKNVGFEENGKGEFFMRPIIVLKKFNKDMFFGIPLSSKIKDGKFYYKFTFKKNNIDNENIALLSQMKLFSSKRLMNKIGVINAEDFKLLKSKFIDLIK